MRSLAALACLSAVLFVAACSSSPDTSAGTGGGPETTSPTASGTTGTGQGGLGGKAGTGGEAGAGGAGGGVQSPLAGLMPREVLIDNDSTSVLKAPKVMPITYDNDANRADIEAFVPNFAQSAAWTDETAEYGVGALTLATPRHIAGNAPLAPTDDDVTALLTANLGDATSPWGIPDRNTIYAFFFPDGTIENGGDGLVCCTDDDGYHSSFQVGNVEVPYAVLCQCPTFDGPNITNLEQLTVVAAHEIVEAVTDSFYDDPGYAQADDDHAVWSYVTGGELADMCEYADTTFWTPPDMKYMVQRTWSNKAAAAGHDPCVGDPTKPYYQAFPEESDAVSIAYSSYIGTPCAPWKTVGTTIAMGATGMVTLDIHADAPSGPFNFSLQDWNYIGNCGPALLDFTVPSAPVKDGDKIQVSIKVLGQDPNLGAAEAYQVTLSPVSGNGPSTYNYGLVGQ
jgi:hypothetical protein